MTALTEYSKVDWGDGSAVQEGVVYGTTHDYEEGTYTVTLINIYSGLGGTGCIGTGTVTVVAPPPPPPEADIPCPVSTRHNEAAGFYVDGYEGGDEPGYIDYVTDTAGHQYKVVYINSGTTPQCWMAVNLRCEISPKTGSNIVNHNGAYTPTGPDNYFITTTGKSAHWLKNDSTHATYPIEYGLLYNMCAALDVYNTNEFDSTTNNWTPSLTSNRGICPRGWHIPTKDEWTILKNACSNNAHKLATGDWEYSSTAGSPGYGAPNFNNIEGRNESGFSALPAGYYLYQWDQNSLENKLPNVGTAYWSSTKRSSGNAFSYSYLLNTSKTLPVPGSMYARNNSLLSVRCVRDSE